jgi:acetyltransferase-like isoleucine patch superfamily enzyme
MFKVTGEGEVEIGQRTRIGLGAQIIFQVPAKVVLGDYCVVGDGVKIVVSGGNVTIGDWTTLHDNCLVLSTVGVSVDQHCWFGQNCVIDGTGGMRIGRGVRVGMYSQLWSHVAAGERMEGCTLFAEREVNLHDNVWLVGTCIVASGVSLGQRLVALIGSNITKSFPQDIVIAGVPATPRPNLSFYEPVTSTEKAAMLRGWLDEFCSSSGFDRQSGTGWECVFGLSGDAVYFAEHEAVAAQLRGGNPAATVCCIETKTYQKMLTDVEQKALKFLAGNKARFYTDRSLRQL